MGLPEVSKEALLSAMSDFDRTDRLRSEWAAWEQNGNYDYAIEHGGVLYPVKDIVSRASGVPKNQFSGGAVGANRVVERAGLRVRKLARVGAPRSLPPLPRGAQVWAEITTTDHGGEGWELSRVLWSPSKDKAGTDKYALLREIRPGDLVVHLVKTDNGERTIWGVSSAAGAAETVDEEPPEPRSWAGQAPYLRVRLENAVELQPKLLLRELEKSADSAIRKSLSDSGFAFTRRGDGYRLFPGYFRRLTPELYEALLALDERAAARNGVTAHATSKRAPLPRRSLSDVAQAFSEALRGSHVDFGPQHDKLAATFIASLATKGFVILSGLSGSGKTQLALRFGDWLGADRRLLVPVRPDWTGPEAMLGYEDALLPPVAGFRPWAVPPSLEFILRAASDPYRPYLLILDEMNLAHVERYLADVLSGMESDEPVIPNLRRTDGGWVPVSGMRCVRFPPNLMVVGTVNVDETTYMFSPKVLDRANTLEFRVSTDALPSDPHSLRRPRPCAGGPDDLVSSFLDALVDRQSHQRVALDQQDFLDEIRKLHALLVPHGFEFGHRVLFEGMRLSALLHDAGIIELDEQLDVFLMQRILPKLHGSRRRLEPVLRQVAGFCYAADAHPDGLDPELPPAGTPRLPRAFEKTRRVMGILRAHQFASFAD